MFDHNENELNLCQNKEADIIVKATVPTKNFYYECLEHLENKPFEETDVDDKVKDLFNIAESQISTKLKSHIQSKLETKQEEMEINEVDLKALAEDMEDIVQEKLEAFKTRLEIGEEEELIHMAHQRDVLAFTGTVKTVMINFDIYFFIM